MQRYLLNVGYIGTKYNGVTSNANLKNQHSITDALRYALATIKSLSNIGIVPSTGSRTDAGMHATNTTFHIDLDKKIPPHKITRKVNCVLSAWHEQIRILKTTPVSDSFDSQRAIRRTYVYRFAVAKNPVPDGMKPKIYESSMFVPIEESYRCHFILNDGFDIERVKENAKRLEGTHDFRTFMKVSKEDRTFMPRFCVRKMDSIIVRPGNTIVIVNLEETLAHYDFWEIELKSKSYFHMQVRNIVGTLIAAGYGKINERTIYEMLTIPSKRSWDHQIRPAPSYGSYLTSVEYPAEVLENCIQTFEGNKAAIDKEDTQEDDLDDSEDDEEEKYIRD